MVYDPTTCGSHMCAYKTNEVRKAIRLVYELDEVLC
jgi:hypothetical protein